MTPGLISYCCSSMGPIQDCLRDHCKGDEALFCETYGPRIDHYRFRQIYCPGFTKKCPVLRRLQQ